MKIKENLATETEYDIDPKYEQVHVPL